MKCQSSRGSATRETHARGWMAGLVAGCLLPGLVVSCAGTGSPLDTGTKQGAALGGILGAITGAAISKHNNARGWGGAAIGAATGAVGGGLIGQYEDRQNAGARDAIPPAPPERSGASLQGSVSSPMLFDSGSSQLEPGAYERLRSVARTVNDNPVTRVVIQGHTDLDEQRLDQQLSEERADRVRSFLISEGVSAGRITAVGYGASMPVASNASEAGRTQNRRVEIEIQPDRAALGR